MNERDDAVFWADQFTELMRMAATITNAADAVMDAMRGDLGGITDRAEAGAEIKRRITAYSEAKRELGNYGRAMMAALELASA
jgi:hypothetical protein